MKVHWVPWCRSHPRFSGSIRCSIRSGMISASKNSAKKSSREPAQVFAELISRVSDQIFEPTTLLTSVRRDSNAFKRSPAGKVSRWSWGYQAKGEFRVVLPPRAG